METSRNISQTILSFLLVSVGMMTTITFGFVPLLNYFETYMTILFALFFWAPFGISCILFGLFKVVDRIKTKELLCFSFIVWGFIVILLNFTYTNVILTLVLVSISAALTGLNVITGANYMSSNIPMNRRGFYAGVYLGIGWGIVAITAFISFLDLHINFWILAISNILVGLISFLLVRSRKVEFEWKQLIVIPRDYNIKKNMIIFWISSLVFSTFLGIIVFLLGTSMRFDESMKSFYLENLRYYFATAESYNLGLINFDFIAVGALNFLLSPIFGKLMDKYGRKPVYFLSNLLIPCCLIFLAFWNMFTFIVISLAIYSVICANYVIIECTVWCDLAPEGKMGQYNGYGWSSMGLGGAVGFLVGYLITTPAFLAQIDLLVVMTIIGLSEISMIPFISMRDSLPPAEEMEWQKKILHIYVIAEGGIVMSDFSFLKWREKKDPLIERKTEEFDPNLFSGGISGVSTMLKEMIDSQQSKLKVIDHEDKKLLFEYGKGFTSVLISSKDLKILRNKLKTLTEEIQNVFSEQIEHWDGDLDKFLPVKTMIKNRFEIN
ncbi:MAG: MFS transporter [Promethearchaeota archaeon]|nr:MAG: MFS transporter [Candidatus Lokiarchaeota archaeon]